jgi:hypothetical protein
MPPPHHTHTHTHTHTQLVCPLSLLGPAQCGDLNLVALLHLLWILGVCQTPFNHAINCMASCKLLWAYTGQMSHRQAHMPASERPWWATAAQSVGLFVSPALHNAHHRTYDDGFPILNGLTAPLIKAMNYLFPDKRIWLGIFVVTSLLDVVVLSHFAKALLGNM